MIKWFGNDKDGLTKKDFEKIVLVLAFLGCVVTACITYWIANPHYIDPNFVGFTTFVGLLMVGRKVTSYWKPDRYNGTDTTVEDVAEDVITTVNKTSTTVPATVQADRKREGSI